MQLKNPITIPIWDHKPFQGNLFLAPKWFTNQCVPGKQWVLGSGGYYSLAAQGSRISLGPAMGFTDFVVPQNQSPAYVTPTVGLRYQTMASLGAFSGVGRRNPEYNLKQPLQGHPLSGCRPPDTRGYFAWDAIMGGGIWIDTPTAHGILFIQTTMLGQLYYYNSTSHCGGISRDLMVYDPNEIGKVLAGIQSPSVPLPAAFWRDNDMLPIVQAVETHPESGGVGQYGIGGMALDPTSQLLFVRCNGSWTGVSNEPCSAVVIIELKLPPLPGPVDPSKKHVLTEANFQLLGGFRIPQICQASGVKVSTGFSTGGLFFAQGELYGWARNGGAHALVKLAVPQASLGIDVDMVDQWPLADVLDVALTDPTWWSDHRRPGGGCEDPNTGKVYFSRLADYEAFPFANAAGVMTIA